MYSDSIDLSNPLLRKYTPRSNIFSYIYFDFFLSAHNTKARRTTAKSFHDLIVILFFFFLLKSDGIEGACFALRDVLIELWTI